MTRPGGDDSRGAVRFARYAYPPNALGYCGPADARSVLEHAAGGVGDAELRHLAGAFEGAWPYLQLIAAANGLQDPLDERVVEAYWLGNRLLDNVSGSALRAALIDRFAARLGRDLSLLADDLPARAQPHHAFHVFRVYPWVGLLRSGPAAARHSLRVLDRCRISWGRVATVSNDHAMVRVRQLIWDGTALGLGAPRAVRFATSVDGYGLVPDLRSGDLVSLHWNWVCERLSPRAALALRTATSRQLHDVNSGSRPPATALR